MAGLTPRCSRADRVSIWAAQTWRSACRTVALRLVESMSKRPTLNIKTLYRFVCLAPARDLAADLAADV